MTRTLGFVSILTMAFVSWPTISSADITIAVVGGMAGPLEKIGTEFKQGTRGAVDAINSGGGLLGEKITILVRDDQCDPKEAKAIAEELAAKKIPFVMGHLCSDASIAASDVYEKAGIIQISPSSTNPKLTERGMKNIFRTIGRDDMQGFVIAEHILRCFKVKRLGIIVDDNNYSKGVAQVAQKFLNQAGIREVFFATAPSAPYDFSTILEQIRDTKVEVVLYPGLPGPVSELAKQIKIKKLKLRLIGSDAFSGIKFDDQNRRLLDGAQFSFPPDPADDRRNKKIKQRYKAAGYNPEAFTFYSYAAVQVWGGCPGRC